jgi:serine/threonine-protein kinase
MEFVDGEDLSSLLTRIGRLPAAKVIDIARELCAGLAAAHDKGVIHRDLKPANVMIDGKGRARIADFGVAALTESIDLHDVAGTPAYMAPELLEGRPASVASDLYALGLVLHELCTGKRLHSGRSLDEIRAAHASDAPSLSNSVNDIPVALERVVLRCLARDPDARPASARAVMAALPGGDPLQAALAAGETPSPAMVAADGKVGDLRPALAWTGLLLALAGLALLALISASSTLIGRMAPDKSPEVLTEKATEILATLGYSQVPLDRHGSFSFDTDFIAWVAAQDASPERWATLADARPGPLLFRYRQSPLPLVAQRTLLRPGGPSEVGRITWDDPAPTTPGMIGLTLDRHGRLVGLRAVPTFAAPGAAAAEPDWDALLAAAALDPTLLTPVPLRAPVPIDSDHKIAWDGVYPGQPLLPVHIEAAAFQGRPVWLRIDGPWLRTPEDRLPGSMRVAMFTVLAFLALALTAIGVLLRRNLRLGRGDRQGAWRLVVALTLSTLLAQGLRADHVSLAFEETGLILNLIAQTFLYAGATWCLYIALEPIARRRWPHLLVGWSRLLAGRIGDPLVGRDLLIGTLGGIALALIVHLAIVMPTWFGWPPPAPRGQVTTVLGGLRHLAYVVFWTPFAAVSNAFGTLFALFLYRSLLRVPALALGLLWLTLFFSFSLYTGIEHVISLAGALFAAVYLLLVLRGGLLAAAIGFYVYLLLEATPLTLDFGRWYADRTLLSLSLLGAVLIYGSWRSLAGKSAFGRAFSEAGPDA